MAVQPLKIAVALLTYNRFDLLRRTYTSLCAGGAFALEMVDNGSTDGSAAWVLGCGGYANRDGNHTTGHGMNLAITRALAHAPDIVLFTADDYAYQPGWYEKLAAFWTHAPAEIALAALNVEPLWGWNGVTAQVAYGGVRALLRDSLPGSNWSFRAADWPRIGPVAEKTGGEDLEICQRLRAAGRQLAALHLAEHTGAQCSVWGNQSWTYARPLPEELLRWMEV
jgi:glycosyltransferase involved in cell wall biosynthesis